MTETISARDANHHFARLLREVQGGKQFVVTRNGVPVARIVPEPVPGSAGAPQTGIRKLTPAQELALAQTLERLSVGWPLGIEKVDREDLYDDARPWMKDYQ
jgi:prevent-host-death family protein